MRKLDFNEKKYFENDLENGILQPIIKYVKENDDVFLGIRNKEIILYSAGAKILDIKFCKKGVYSFSFDVNHYENKDNLPKNIKKLLDLKYVSNVETVNKWISNLDVIKGECVKFNYKHKSNKFDKNGNTVYYSNKEKIIQQALLEQFNTEGSNYFNYDIEYVFQERGITIPYGRVDNMVIGIPKNNTVKLYLLEVKNGSTAISGVNSTTEKEIKSFGSGVVGHVYNYMKLLELIYDNKDYVDKTKEKNNIITSKQVRDHFLNEIKYAMKFYKKFNLLKNSKFTNVNWNEINKLEVELVFYISNQNSKESFFNHLGIGKGNSEYNVKKFLKNTTKAINGDIYDFNLRDFKYLIDLEKFEVNDKYVVKSHKYNLDIECYSEMKKEAFDI